MLEYDYHIRTRAQAEKEPARKNLVHVLQGEYRGSVKVQALTDAATQERALMHYHFLREQEKPDLGELILASAELAAINETVRRNSFGEDAIEYTSVFDSQAGDHKVDYNNQEGLRRGENMNTVFNNTKLRRDSADIMLIDLKSINRQLPLKKESAPANRYTLSFPFCRIADLFRRFPLAITSHYSQLPGGGGLLMSTCYWLITEKWLFIANTL